ncbi:hypothetical protein [Chryseobacterium sp. PMSZPI]|uniref:hypothetical protein n=1 Tax=Chryseobacterium sp. PMSZPI TaxID=1033900 RepID=UPI000C3445F8|nr:hypothetical protein [Chryseobacterium sp. PMSZPI]PKF76064.1 hypothetical protein CW752_00310 [Chryseobacterium sp. PMSZPI]
MIKKSLLLPLVLVTSLSTHAQVGIQTQNPQGVFNVDGLKDNPATGTPTPAQQLNDFVITSNGSVGIGTTSPDNSAKFEVKAQDKGALLPRIPLTSSTDQTTIPSPAVGLLVYNTGTGGLGYKGYVFWNGTEWRTFNNSSSDDGTVGSIICGSANLSPSSYTAGTFYNGTMTVPYTGGNGGAYPSQVIGPVNGLTATLTPGNFNIGSGTLVYRISGTPTVTSPVTTTFPLNIGGQTCNATVGQGTQLDVGGVTGTTYFADATTMNVAGKYMSANVKYGASMPVFEGLMFDVVSVNATYYKPILKNITGSPIVVHINTAAHSVNEGRQLIGLTIPPNVEQGIDSNDIVFWQGPPVGTVPTAPVGGTNYNAEVSELFLAVRVATGAPDTYKFYRFLYQIVQFNGEKVMFTTLQRVM